MISAFNKGVVVIDRVRNRTENQRQGTSGQMLIESVVATILVIILVTGLIAGTTASLRAGQSGRDRSQANKFAQEGIEMTRNFRNAGWIPFFSQSIAFPAVRIWCLPQDNIWPGSSVLSLNDCDRNINNLFGRSVSFSWSNPRMIVVSTVRWNDGSTTHKSELTTYFTQWR